MRKPITITLADQEYRVRPLTLGTIRQIDLLKVEAPPEGPQAQEEFLWNQYLSVLSLALSEDQPDMTVDKLLTLRTDISEVGVAYRAIMVHSGLVVSSVEARPPQDQPVT